MDSNNRFINFFWKIEDRVLEVCLSVMGIVIFAQVVSRYVLKMPLMWSEEAARYLQVWICFLGMGYGVRNKAHVRVEFFINKMSKKVKHIIFACTNLLTIFFLIYFLPGVLRFIADQSLIKSSAMSIPMNIVYIVLPIGIISTIISLLIDTWVNIRQISEKREGEVQC